MLSTFHRFLLLALTLLSVSVAFGSGFVRVKNFPKEKYSGGAQNWCAAQDPVGKVYVGNRDGLLVFDGERWKKNYLSNYSTVRSLLYDDESLRLYAAGTVEFGFFSNDGPGGSLKYHSLVDLMPKNREPYTEIWNIFKLGDNIWFQADNFLFCYTGSDVKVYPMAGRVATSALIGNLIYVALEDGRIFTMPGKGRGELREYRALRNKKISAILPFGDDGLLVGTAFDGLFTLEGGEAKVLNWDVNPFLKKSQLFCGYSDGDQYVFGTVSGGAVLVDPSDGYTGYINKNTGLQNNTVLNIFSDADGNLWLCLDNGLDYAVLNSPMYNLINRNFSIGAGYVSKVVGDRILYGTNEGLFSTLFPYPQSPAPPQMQKELPGQIWAIDDTPRGTFVASDAGIDVYDGHGFSHTPNIHGAYRVLPLPGSESLALAATYEGFRLLRHSASGWSDAGAVTGCEDLAGNFSFDSKGNIWVTHWRHGVYRLALDPDKASLAVSHLYNSKDGLPADDYNSAAEFDGRIRFSTRDGFYKLNPAGKVVRDEEMNEVIPGGRQGSLRPLPDGSLLFIDNMGILRISRLLSGNLSARQLASGNFRELLIPGYINVNCVSPDELIISTQDGFNLINTARSGQAKESWRNPFVSTVYANRDSIIYASAFHPDSGSLKLPYNLNSVKFEFAYPDFDNAGGVEFSSFLENYEEDWSPFSNESTREYTRLAEGDYKLHLRVRDSQSGEIRESVLGFTIAPPWFRTTLAKILYIVSIVIMLGLLTAGIRHWADSARRASEQRKEEELERLRKQSEQEALKKDFEIASLKTEQLEQDIKHKSQELSNTAMSLIHKNEILNDISVQLSMLQQLTANDSSRALILKNLSKIQASIEKSINEDNDWDTFNKNFDVVYSDYTKKLSELHPNLSNSDKRLCCYIRMGLSSKEIAPLINISYKSVEMARYRLRKKINLPGNTSLTDYLTSL